MATIRNTQLDGLRAVAVAGVMWYHWAPAAWRGPVPFEIGLFYFLTLTGFLITRILLRERAAGEASGVPWRWRCYQTFQARRVTRIIAPCYAAMLVALAVGAPDIRAHPLVYFAQVSNWHMAMQPDWPSGTAPFWTLGIQMQFYLIWPLVVFLMPRRALAPAFLAAVAVAPVSRWIIEAYFPSIYHTGAITFASLDYMAVGALLAYALEQGMPAANPKLTVAAWLALLGYATLSALHLTGHTCGGLGYLQQTLLSVAFAGLIAASLAGLHGPCGRWLNHPAVQHVGRLSYSLYLFHTLVPLLLGKILPVLWWPVFDGPLLAVRLLVFALASWGVAWLCWRWLEQPVFPSVGASVLRCFGISRARS